MATQEKVTTAFWAQFTMLSIPLGILLTLKIVAFIFRNLVSEETLNKWFKPPNEKEEAEGSDGKTKKPKLSQGPYVEKPSEELPYLPESINSLMQIVVRKSKDRGVSNNHSWLTSYHTFSFGKYNDQKFIGYGSLRILNDEFINPNNGYPQLVRQDFEIMTIVLSGTLRHLDSLENETILSAGQSQIMTCGSGITHIEENSSPVTELNFIQLWFAPNFDDLKPGYQRRDFNGKLLRNQIIPIASPYYKVDKMPVNYVTADDIKRQELPGASKLKECVQPKPKTNTEKEKEKETDSSQLLDDSSDLEETKINNTLALNSDTYVYQCILEPGCKVKVPVVQGQKRKAYVHVCGTDGNGLLSINYEDRLEPGDGAFLASLASVTSIDMKNIGTETCQFIFLDMA